MLADLSISYWEGRRKDTKLSENVRLSANATRDAGDWWTKIIPPSELKDISRAISRGRSIHASYTLPWKDGGLRILPADMYLQYTKDMRAAKEGYIQAVEAFLGRYPLLVDQARERLGDLYEGGVYPEIHALRAKFGWVVEISPLPDAGDFRVDLGAEQTERLRANIEEQLNRTMASSMRDLWKRLHTVISHVAERLDHPENTFRDSLIRNVATLCDLLPKLNISGDPALEEMREKIVQKIAAQDPEVLRRDDTARALAKTSADRILKDMAPYIGEGK